MSQHYFKTTHQGRPITITLGFDRPLQGYFCTVERNDAAGEDDAYLYCNLDDPTLSRHTGMAETVDYFDALLMARGFTVPRAMIAEVERDGVLNVGNRRVWYDAAGAVSSAPGM
jgi:hypothetical protein